MGPGACSRAASAEARRSFSGIGISVPSSAGSDLYAGSSEPASDCLRVDVEAGADGGERVPIFVQARSDLEFGRGPALVRAAGEPAARDVADDCRAADAEPRCDVVHEIARRVRGEESVDLGGLEAALALPG